MKDYKPAESISILMTLRTTISVTTLRENISNIIFSKVFYRKLGYEFVLFRAFKSTAAVRVIPLLSSHHYSRWQDFDPSRPLQSYYACVERGLHFKWFVPTWGVVIVTRSLCVYAELKEYRRILSFSYLSEVPMMYACRRAHYLCYIMSLWSLFFLLLFLSHLSSFIGQQCWEKHGKIFLKLQKFLHISGTVITFQTTIRRIGAVFV